MLHAGTAAAGSAAGWAAHMFALPLAWLIGPLCVSAALALGGLRLGFDRVRPWGLVVLGLALGQNFTPEILRAVAGHLPVIFACAVATLSMGLPVARIFTGIAKVDPKTAFFCAVPGGVVLMAIQAQRAGASQSHVVLAQTVRLVAVVASYPLLIALLLPGYVGGTAEPTGVHVQAMSLGDLPRLLLFFLAGACIALIARRIAIPNPWMLAPCIFAIVLGAFDAQPIEMPKLLVVACQVVLGLSLGAQMSRDFLFSSGRLLAASTISALILTALLMLMAIGVAQVTDLPLSATLLGMAPGGMPEMTVAAQTIGASVPLVLSFHLARLVIGNLLIEPIWKMVRRLGFV